MTYADRLAEMLVPSASDMPLVLDLFAGCGGLALGFEAQGFETLGFEFDADCCESYRFNLRGDCTQIKLNQDSIFPKARVVIGGPPCQPFSVGGHQKGMDDARNGFPAFISAIRQAQPDVWLFENVKGLLYRNRKYLDEVIAELETLGYKIEVKVVNAVDFGVPQNRERLIVVGHRDEFFFPPVQGPRVTAGEALDELTYQVSSDSRFLTPSMDAYVARYEAASKCVNPRDLALDRPARTLTCRNLAGATGDMQRVRLPDGRRRRLTIQDAARLQSFPDHFEFKGSEASCFNQIGNAVPPLLAYALAASVKSHLNTPIQKVESAKPSGRFPIQLSLIEA